MLNREIAARTNLAAPKGAVGTHVRTDGTAAEEMPAVVLSKPPMVAAADLLQAFVFTHNVEENISKSSIQ